MFMVKIKYKDEVNKFIRLKTIQIDNLNNLPYMIKNDFKSILGFGCKYLGEYVSEELDKNILYVPHIG
ncbi:MAG: hypothetical protein ACRC0F_08225 [Cetobacterium sp.]